MKPRIRGIVEGFYWSPDDPVNGRSREFDPDKRMALIRRMGEKGLNAYLYDPKWMRGRRDRPSERALNPEWIGDRSAWAETFRVARDTGVQFLWGLAPGPSSNHRGGESGLFAVVEQVLDLGADGVALLFDDVPGAETEDEERRQARLAHRLTERFPTALRAFCPASYSGSRSDLEMALSPLDDGLPAELPLLWTGPAVRPATVHGDDVPRLRHRGVALWDNWMASDSSDPEQLELRPPLGRDESLFTRLDGYLLNPAFPVERMVPAVPAVADMLRRGSSVKAPDDCADAGGDDLPPEYEELLQRTAAEWAAFLGCPPEPLVKLLRKNSSERQEAPSQAELAEIYQRWPSLPPVFNAAFTAGHNG